MEQLVELQDKAADQLKKHDATVLVVFREESEGQEGLTKVVEKTKTEFILVLDTNAEQTKQYSPGDQVHDSYIIDSDGVICAILAGKRYDRAQPNEFVDALNDLIN